MPSIDCAADRSVEPDQQFDESGLSRPGRSDERDGISQPGFEGDVIDCVFRRGAMSENNVFKPKILEFADVYGFLGPFFNGLFHQFIEHLH